MRAKTLMVQGTASSVGKSVLVTAFCRIFKQDGFSVAPFKAQNMSLNSFVTAEGGEIGRAQVVQAEAAGVRPTVEMNPILLKPEGDNRSQVIVGGKPRMAATAGDYYALRDQLWSVVTQSLESLLAQYDIVFIEGAGSPAEVNLKERDMVNMRVALYCQAPVLLVGDIERGGLFASMVGTLDLLEPEERDLVRALVINKFRGDISLLTPGIKWLEERSRVPVAGVIPYFEDIRIAEEDSLSLERRRALKAKKDYVLDIGVIGLPHISNFDDFDPLEQEQGVRLRYIEAQDELGRPDLVILPGTKSTIADLCYLKSRGLDREIVEQARSGTPVIGICGGYQMLGDEILDPDHVESPLARAEGLALLPVRTTFYSVKSTNQVRGCVAAMTGLLNRSYRVPLTGYEIHMGKTDGLNINAPFEIEERSGSACREREGCLSSDGNVLGTYLHGLFHNLELRQSLLRTLAERKGAALPSTPRTFSKDEEYDRLADLVRSHLDVGLMYRMLGLKKREKL